MKNHRDVCLATEAGYVEYLGLPGRVKTGCANTPDFKSRYCSLHKPTATVSHPKDTDIASTSTQLTGNQVGVILRKKSTRAQTFYHVCTSQVHKGHVAYNYIIHVYNLHVGCMVRPRYYHSNMGARNITSFSTC